MTTTVILPPPAATLPYRASEILTKIFDDLSAPEAITAGDGQMRFKMARIIGQDAWIALALAFNEKSIPRKHLMTSFYLLPKDKGEDGLHALSPETSKGQLRSLEFMQVFSLRASILPQPNSIPVDTDGFGLIAMFGEGHDLQSTFWAGLDDEKLKAVLTILNLYQAYLKKKP